MYFLRLTVAAALFALLSCTTAPKKKPQTPAPMNARQEFNKAQIDAAEARRHRLGLAADDTGTPSDKR